MRAIAAVVAALPTTASAAPAPTHAGDGTSPSRARVAFIRTVSGPTPFADSCGAQGAVYEDAEVEPHLSVDPRNHLHLLATWQQDRFAGGGARSNLAAVSRNGGRNWQVSTLPGVSTCTGGHRLKASDPWTAIGTDGTAYVSSFAVTDPGATGDGLMGEFDGDTVISRSLSGGATWDPPSIVAEDDGTYWHEKAVIEADPGAAETLYAVWARHLMPDPTHLVTTTDVALAFARSDDGGGTWSEPVALPPDAPWINEWPFGGILALPATGGTTPLVVVGSARNARVDSVACTIYATRSDDGGSSWRTPTVIAVQSGFPAIDTPELTHVRGGTGSACLASSAVAADGTAYVVWFDRTPGESGPDGTVIRIARSDDGAETWERGVVARVAAPSFLPTVAVAGDGTVGVSYFDTADDEPGDDEFTTQLRFASSDDGGAAWEHIDVTGPFDLRTAPVAAGYMLGDYDGLVGLPDGFGALVALARPTAEIGRTDIFYVRITLDDARR